MEILLAFDPLIMLIIFGIDASQKPREFLRKHKGHTALLSS